METNALMDALTGRTELDDIHLFVQDLLHRLDRFELAAEISVDDLFNLRFMHEHTAFESFDEMMTAAGVVVVRSLNELDTDDRWKQFVIDRTSFESWAEMLDEATREWMASELDLMPANR
jgi:predicted transcriptional regulator